MIIIGAKKKVTILKYSGFWGDVFFVANFYKSM